MEIALVCTADAGYVIPLAVMLRSVIANLRAGATLSVYAIDGGITRQDKERLARFTLSRDVPLHWLDPPAARTSGLSESEAA